MGKRLFSTIFIVTVAIVLSGCATTFGSKTVPNARFDYNNAIAKSTNDQLLLNLVRLRYRDTTTFLDVNDVVTRYTYVADAGASASLGINSSASDRIGLDGGVNYIESPTITYKPLQGSDYVRRFLSPLSIETIILLSQGGWSIERLLLCCVDQVNKVSNTKGAAGPTPAYFADNNQFRTLASSLRRLQMANLTVVDIREGSDGKLSFYLFLDPNSEATDAELGDLATVKQLLELDANLGRYEITAFPAAVKPSTLIIKGRSLLGVLYALSHAVEVPPSDTMNGLVTTSRTDDGSEGNWYEANAGQFRVACTDDRPDQAFVSIEYRNNWCWIADNDLETKTTFGLLNYLIALQSDAEEALPTILTIGVD